MGSAIRSRELTNEDWVGLDRPIFHPAIGAFPAALGRYLLFFLFALILGIALAVALGVVGETWLPGFTPDSWRPLQVVSSTVVLFWGPILLVPLYIAARAFLHAYRRKLAIWLDLRDRRVEVIEVNDARTIVAVDGRQRTYFLIDIGNGRTLLIDAQCIPLDPDLLLAQLPPEGSDEDGREEEGWYALRPDFPNSSFALHRLPRTGHIVRFETRGHTLLPIKVLSDGDIPLPALADIARKADCGSLILQQDFDALV